MFAVSRVLLRRRKSTPITRIPVLRCTFRRRLWISFLRARPPSPVSAPQPRRRSRTPRTPPLLGFSSSFCTQRVSAHRVERRSGCESRATRRQEKRQSANDTATGALRERRFEVSLPDFGVYRFCRYAVEFRRRQKPTPFCWCVCVCEVKNKLYCVSCGEL